MSFSTHVNNKNHNIYILGKDFSQINGTTIYAEKMCKTNFTEPNKKFVLSLHYNGDNSYLFVNGVQQLKFKTKNSGIKRIPLRLGNISLDASTTNQTKTGLYGRIYDFAVDYVPISNVGKIYDIHRYLMKKITSYKRFRLIKKVLTIILTSTSGLFNLANTAKCISLKKIKNVK